MSKFKADLSIGQAGEELLLKMWPSLERLSGRHSDFLTPTYELLELKTDRRRLSDTPNMFIEVWSNKQLKRPGGLWQAFGRGSTLWAYMHLPDQIVHIYRTVQLLEYVEARIGEGRHAPLKVREVWNPRYTTVGVLLPREDVGHLVIDVLGTKQP